MYEIDQVRPVLDVASALSRRAYGKSTQQRRRDGEPGAPQHEHHGPGQRAQQLPRGADEQLGAVIPLRPAQPASGARRARGQ